MNKKQSNQLLFLLATALWGYLIFYLSSTPDLSSGLPTIYDFVLRKFAHAFVFLVLTYLLASSLDSQKRRCLLFVAIITIFYALVDEAHQTSVANRNGSSLDILVDSIGVCVGIWLYQHWPPDQLKKFRKPR